MKFINIILLITVVSTQVHAFDTGQIISDAIRSYDQVKDYTCLFYKKELVHYTRLLNLIKIGVIILGLAPGLRDLLRVTIGV
jgi:hypothetical protein